ncbi:hybrid sensor histidine kinase/response regulator transcription factor [Formosa sp. S-31]|uniref:hybrid sensor histidine kinase/response regulator transcription factor n=1 Tax=Formosa sp. S-31 TaxID=2790949 RepID=UPI003EB8B3A7
MSQFKRAFSLVFFVLCFSHSKAQHTYNFKKIEPVYNNSTVGVKQIIQGPFNTIWMVCGRGILVYDGYDYKLIPHSTIFKGSPTGDSVNRLEKDDTGIIWMLANSGRLYRYNLDAGTFDVLDHMENEMMVSALAIHKTDVWVATNTGGIYRYNGTQVDSITAVPKRHFKKSIQSLVIHDNKSVFFSTQDGRIYDYSLTNASLKEIAGVFTDFPGGLVLETDENNRLWIGTETYGLFVYDLNTGKYIQDDFFKGNTYNLDKELILNLFLDSSGYIWGGTDGGGIYKINSDTGSVELFSSDDTNAFSLSSNTILDITEDKHKNIWLTPNYGQLNVLSHTNPAIKYHSGSANNVPQRVLSMLKSSDGSLWIGTDGSGITRVSRDKNNQVVDEQFFNNVLRNKGFYIQSIAEDQKQNIWFGTYRNGLWHYSKTQKTFKKIDLKNLKQHHATDVRVVFSDRAGRIWVGSNIGVHIYNSDFNLLASFEYGYKGLEGTIVESIYQDDAEGIWLGAHNGGFFQFHEQEDDLSNSVFENVIPESEQNRMNYFIPKSMTGGANHSVWMVNLIGNLIKFDTNTHKFTTFKNNETLNKAVFLSVVSEDEYNLWMGSLDGVNHLKLKDTSLVSYYNSDGFEDNTYMNRSAYKDRDGQIYFGSVKGVNYFMPDAIRKTEAHPELYVNSIEVLNQPLESVLSKEVYKNVYRLSQLNLDHNQASFSFRFSAIDNVLNHNYVYAYRLKGFDKDWIASHPERLATYTNISPGNYEFEVKAGTVKGIWDIEPKTIKITVNQPFWNSRWAYMIYLALLVALGFFVRRWYVFRRRMLMEKVLFKKEHELHDLKMDFFTKMSHEIQTPITLILGPIEDMMRRAEKNGNLLLKQRLHIIENNAKRLSKIARDLTLVRDKELKTLRLAVTKNNVFNDIEDIALSFRELARKKQIDFVVNCPQNLSEAWYDKDKIEHVIYNLLSNAFKFTPKDGNIQLTVLPFNDKRTIKIQITDSGPGISKEELHKIFKIFYQSEIGKKRKGSGIGLALTKELIDLHAGSIEVNSSAEEGTSFLVVLPISESDYKEEDKIVSSEPEVEELPTAIDIHTVQPVRSTEIDDSKKTVLIVEDNLDLQEFLKELLINEYNILLAENGEEGYHYAKSNFPDLIISDIMMPVIDGVAMCNMLQKDYLTKHIPVILLTAKNSINSKISGLKSGAIEYINKPFNTNELLLKVRNIISSKEHIISQYRAEAISNPEVTIQKSKDEVFLESLMSVLNSRLTDSDLKMEELADALNMSYSSFYRKCQALTGHSIIDFVRLIRLKKAAVILAKFGYTISEVAFMVGFNDPKYFSKCFKKQFGKTPKVFSSEAQKEGVDACLKRHNLSEV